MTKRLEKSRQAITAESENLVLQMIRLKSIFSLDLQLIEDDRNDEEHGMAASDPRRNEVSLKLNSFSIPFAITPKAKTELKKFFKEKGWEFVSITSTPSIKLKKIQEGICAKQS